MHENNTLKSNRPEPIYFGKNVDCVVGLQMSIKFNLQNALYKRLNLNTKTSLNDK